MRIRWTRFRPSCAAPGARSNSFCGCGIHGAAARRNTGPALGKLSGRGVVRFSLNLEWPGFGPQNSQRPRPCSGHPTTCRSAGNASATLREPLAGPIFVNSLCKPLSLGSVVNRVILPALNRCEACGKAQSDHEKAEHSYKRDTDIPEWHGWHAARRGLGSNLYRLGVPDMVIQRILRHANVSTTATYYIKTAADDVRLAMTKLENRISAFAQPEMGASEPKPILVSPKIQ